MTKSLMQSHPTLTYATNATLAPEVAVPYLDEDVSIGIVHFGVGNFHRSHQAMYLDRLLRAGLAHEWGLCGVGLMPQDRAMADTLNRQDGLYTLTLMPTDGAETVQVIGSIRRYLHVEDGADAIVEQLSDPGVRIVSLTITEGAYAAPRLETRLDAYPAIEAEILGDLAEPQTVFGFIVAALRRRRERGIAAFTVLSCDNMQSNGRIARRNTLELAALVDTELAEWIEKNATFPSTMVDRITPATTDADRDRIRARLGVEDAWPVSAEPFAQWVIEDDFAQGRPALERVGAEFTNDIDAYEKVKLRLLNAPHQVIAYIGQLRGHTYVDEAMADPGIRRFLDSYMCEEAAPSFTAPAGFDVPGYCATVVERFNNTHVRDTLLRLSVDSSDRVPIFALPVAHDVRAAGRPARLSAALLATWCWYWTADTVAVRSPDHAASRLTLAAERAADEPASFLRFAGVVTAPFAEDSSFVLEFSDGLRLLREDGPEGFLAVYGTVLADG